MVRQGNVVVPSQWQGRSSWSAIVDSALSDLKRWLGARSRRLSGPLLSSAVVLERPGIGRATSDEEQSAAGPAFLRLGLAKWVVGGSAVVSVTGEIDVATTDQLSAALRCAINRKQNGGERPTGIICDLSAVDYLGAAALTALLIARRQASVRGMWFDLVCPRLAQRNVFALVGLDVVFFLHEELGAAVLAQARRDGRPEVLAPATTR